MDKNVWTISGVKVTVDENTNLYGDFVIGQPRAGGRDDLGKRDLAGDDD